MNTLKKWFLSVAGASLFGLFLIFLGIWNEGFLPLLGYVVSVTLIIPLFALASFIFKESRVLSGIGILIVLIQLLFIVGFF